MSAGFQGLPGGARVWEVDGRRVLRRFALLAILAFAVAEMAIWVIHGKYALDFRRGILPAGADVLSGRSPYGPATSHYLLSVIHAFVTPPPIALVAAPFSLLPFSTAVALWWMLDIGAVIVALRLMGVRDARIYLLALASYPMWDSLQNGQPDGLFALAAALAWRYRDSWRGAAAGGTLIAAKLFAWPLMIWLLVTRRFRPLAILIGSTVLIALASWATIGFRGLSEYPRLIATDAKVFEAWSLSFSLVGDARAVGLSIAEARVLAVIVALMVAIAIVALARRSDQGWFSSALTLGVLSSPILWMHYLVVLFVPLAFARRRAFSMWLAFAYVSWLTPVVLRTSAERSVAMIVTTVAAVIWSTARPRPAAGRVAEPAVAAAGTPAVAAVRVPATPGVS